MTSFRDIMDHYRFSQPELETLRKLLPQIEPQVEKITDDFYQFLREMPRTAVFLKDEDRFARLRRSHKEWVLNLFKGPFNEAYHKQLQRIGSHACSHRTTGSFCICVYELSPGAPATGN